MDARTSHVVAFAAGLRAGYGPNTVLRDVSVHLVADTTTVILGPGGSGKSTLLHLLSRSEAPPAGLWTTGVLQVAERRKAAWLPQRLAPEDRSLSTLIRQLPAFEGDPSVPLRECWACAPEAAAVLLREMQTPLRDLPEEIARLAAFTNVVMREERVLLLDEPEVNVGPDGQSWMKEKLCSLRGTKTILLVTHHLEFARRLADYVVLLIDGVVIEEGEAEVFFSGPRQARTRDFVRFGS